MHPNSLANLVPLKGPGPGRPKGSVDLRTMLEKELAKDRRAKAQKLVEATVKGAIEQIPASLKVVWDRMAPTQAEQQGPSVALNLFVGFDPGLIGSDRVIEALPSITTTTEEEG